MELQAAQYAVGMSIAVLNTVELSLVIKGATGDSASAINGTYKPTGSTAGDMHNGRMLYQKEGDPDMWLRSAGSNLMVSPTSAKDEAAG